MKTIKVRTIDEREPVERVADELKDFSSAVMTMSKEQVKTAERLLKAVLLAVKGIENIKVEIPEEGKKNTRWEIHAVRDHEGLIQFPVTIKAVEDK